MHCPLVLGFLHVELYNNQIVWGQRTKTPKKNGAANYIFHAIYMWTTLACLLVHLDATCLLTLAFMFWPTLKFMVVIICSMTKTFFFFSFFGFEILDRLIPIPNQAHHWSPRFPIISHRQQFYLSGLSASSRFVLCMWMFSHFYVSFWC